MSVGRVNFLVERFSLYSVPVGVTASFLGGGEGGYPDGIQRNFKAESCGSFFKPQLSFLNTNGNENNFWRESYRLLVQCNDACWCPIENHPYPFGLCKNNSKRLIGEPAVTLNEAGETRVRTGGFAPRRGKSREASPTPRHINEKQRGALATTRINRST